MKMEIKIHSALGDLGEIRLWHSTQLEMTMWIIHSVKMGRVQRT